MKYNPYFDGKGICGIKDWSPYGKRWRKKAKRKWDRRAIKRWLDNDREV